MIAPESGSLTLALISRFHLTLGLEFALNLFLNTNYLPNTVNRIYQHKLSLNWCLTGELDYGPCNSKKGKHTVSNTLYYNFISLIIWKAIVVKVISTRLAANTGS